MGFVAFNILLQHKPCYYHRAIGWLSGDRKLCVLTCLRIWKCELKKKLCVLRRRGATVHRYYWTLHCIGFVHQSIFKWIKYILHIFYEMWRGKCMIDLASNKKLRYIVPNAWPIIAKFELLINRILECFNKKERQKFCAIM